MEQNATEQGEKDENDVFWVSFTIIICWKFLLCARSLGEDARVPESVKWATSYTIQQQTALLHTNGT